MTSLPAADVTSGKSSRSPRRYGPPFALPGIEISRIDTMDFDDASVAEGLSLSLFHDLEGLLALFPDPEVSVAS